MYRSFFAGLFFLPFIRWQQIRFRPSMLGMVACFAAMNALFVSAISFGTAANAILLQNSAPIFVYLASVYLLGEPPDTRSFRAILIGLVGLGIILISGVQGGSENQMQVMLMALGSGITYAAVILFLRALRQEASQWLVLLNHLGAAICLSVAMFCLLGPTEWQRWMMLPSSNQLLFLVFFGVVQMGLPYYLFTRGLQHISPQEAGIITLLEPMLNPLWAYLIDPEKERIPLGTMIGGLILLAALVYRYWPQGNRVPETD